MARANVKDGGQAGFEDRPLMDQEVAAACEAVLEFREASSSYRKATAKLKSVLPEVAEPTRFIIGESFFVTVNPYEVDSHSVSGGRRQRMRVTDQSSG